MILNNYSMSREAKSAILSGDINWIRQNVGELTSGQSTYLMYRLESTKDMEDKVIAKHIVSALRRNSIINADAIDIKVKNRVVTISGIVPNRYTVMAVYNTTLCTKGVVNVIDMLKVK
jgi:osmotically-inducible protein OsmY